MQKDRVLSLIEMARKMLRVAAEILVLDPVEYTVSESITNLNEELLHIEDTIKQKNGGRRGKC